MIVTVDFDDNEKRTTISAVPDLYEPTMLSPVIVYGTPLLRNADRLHVAVALMLGGRLSGPLHLKDVAPCSRHVALEIARFLAPVDVFVVDQTVKPRANAAGSLRAILGSESRPAGGGDANFMDGDTLFRFVFEGVGAMFSEREVVVGTNTIADPETETDSFGAVCALIGATVLFCEDLHVGTLSLPPAWVSGDAARRDSLRRLLSSVTLEIEWR